MNNYKKAKSVKEIRNMIDRVMLPNYTYRTNFSYSDSLIFINNSLNIAAKLIKHEDKMIYRFILDTQFLSDKEITYDEIKMIMHIIDILEDNRFFVLSRLKKYTVEEYEKEQEEKERQSEAFFKSFTSFFENQLNKKSPEDDYFEY